ncbi:type IV secretory system conjugative DNA transfer family protein [uncultured Roseobacter sp.]|uniref:type IV secretory system conjugative DNA transfer family protein n=1 Tax=uncultured Roseobacter sp. TaxID=114847 RepID=UPI002631E8D8|nr:type IV secretory system conjugative DNA transfer family protein [uncultured Roseobacter sp.]
MTYQSSSPYGDARFARLDEVQDTGLLKPKGVEFGLVGEKPIHHSNRAGVKITGGAGCGKTSQIAVPMILGSPAESFVLLDVKNAELSRIIEAHCAQVGKPLYVIDPFGVADFPALRVSLLSHLKPDSTSLVPDSQRFMLTLLPDSSGDNKFFDQSARRFGDAIVRGDVHLSGGTSFMALFNIVAAMRADFEAFTAWADLATEAGTPDLRATFMEIKETYAGSPKLFDSIMGGLSNALSFMTDSHLRDTFVDDKAADFSLEVITGNRPVIVSFVIADDKLEPLAPLVRQFFSAIRTIKQRSPQARSVNLLIDEAARLGRFGELAEFFSIGRGYGLTPYVFYQDDGQILRNLGSTGKATLEANAAITLDLGGGIRDFETAKARSLALGFQTIAVDDPLIQKRAEVAAAEAWRKVMLEGGDPYEAGLQMRRYDYEAQHKTKMRKALMEPDQLLNLDEGRMLVIARGYHLHPFIADKRPYFTQRRFAGHYLPNPNEERDMQSVHVRTFFGKRRRKIIEEAAPERLAHLPQYSGGLPLRYVDGFKPKF